MKQCAHCGWETSKPEKLSIILMNGFEIKVHLCPECVEAYRNGTQNKNKSPML